MSVGFAKVALASQNEEIYHPSSITIDSEGCISGVFVAEEDGHVVGTITLNSNCTFKLVDPTDGYVTTTTGSYSIDGDLTRGPRLINAETKKEMKKILSEIQDGSFANEFLNELNSGGKKFRELEAKGEDHLVEHVGKKLRSLFSWIKDNKIINRDKN